MNITNNLYFKTPSKCPATSHSNRILAEGYMSARRKRAFTVEPGEKGERNRYVREKMNRVALLFDKIPPVLHKLAQGDQRVLRYGKLVVGSPGFHGNQYYPSLKLVFIDLGQQQNEHTWQSQCMKHYIVPSGTCLCLIKATTVSKGDHCFPNLNALSLKNGESNYLPRKTH